MIEIDLGNFPTGTAYKKPKPPIDREAIQKKWRDAYWLTRKLIEKIRRERKSQHR
jgi:hypothetical protein